MKPLGKEQLYGILISQSVALTGCVAGLVASEMSTPLIFAWFIATVQCLITWVMLFRYEGKRVCADLADYIAGKASDITGKKNDPESNEKT